MTDFNTQTCQPCKLTNVENLTKKKLKKPGESVKNLETLTGHLFRTSKLKEYFKEGFSTLSSINTRQKVTIIFLTFYFIFFLAKNCFYHEELKHLV